MPDLFADALAKQLGVHTYAEAVHFSDESDRAFHEETTTISDLVDKSDHDAVAESAAPEVSVTDTSSTGAWGDRDNKILAAMRSYTGRFSKRNGWPFLRRLSTHAGFRITRPERKRLWPAIAKERQAAGEGCEAIL